MNERAVIHNSQRMLAEVKEKNIIFATQLQNVFHKHRQ